MPHPVISRDDTLALLREHKPALTERFGVVDLALFGSTARDQASPESDIDILVRFDGRAGAKRYFGTWSYLEDLLGRPVDLVSDNALRPEFRPYVEADVGISAARPERLWDCYARDMLVCCEKIIAYTQDLDQACFVADDRTYDATMCNIEIIGASATRIPEAVRKAHEEIPWSDIIATRNRIIHGYAGIDDAAVWDIVRDSVPALVPLLKALLDESARTGGTDRR